MFTKAIIIAVFGAIIFFLSQGLYHLLKHNGQSEQTVRALSWRIGFSMLLFVGLFIAFAFGLITPHGIR